jgi:hypothetical protein
MRRVTVTRGMFRVRYQRQRSSAAVQSVLLTKRSSAGNRRSFRENGTERFFEARSNF